MRERHSGCSWPQRTAKALVCAQEGFCSAPRTAPSQHRSITTLIVFKCFLSALRRSVQFFSFFPLKNSYKNSFHALKLQKKSAPVRFLPFPSPSNPAEEPGWRLRRESSIKSSQSARGSGSPVDLLMNKLGRLSPVLSFKGSWPYMAAQSTKSWSFSR